MVVDISSLSFSYNGVPVLKDISLEVKKKDFVAIIGPNGSGKTTLLQLLLGKLTPNSGSIRIFGKPVEQFCAWHKIGYVPQRVNVDKMFPGTVKELVGAKKIPAGLNLKNLLDKKYSQLSGGQQQRVLIALALQQMPNLLILDEPTVGIDIQSQQNFYHLLKELNEKKGITIIFVTHDVGMVPTHFKRVICLNQTICCQGPVSETEKLLKQAYGSQFVTHTHK